MDNTVETSSRKDPFPLRILYLNAFQTNGGWGAECFVNEGFRRIGHRTHCIDYRKNRKILHRLVDEAPEYDVFFLQRGEFFPLHIIGSSKRPRVFWASELVSRCRDQDRLLMSGLFDHVFFHSKRCMETSISMGWAKIGSSSVLLNGFDENIHRPIPGTPKNIDILFVGSMTARRARILNELRSRFSVHTVSAFGRDLVELFSRSKIVLNLHAEDFLDIETRVFEALGCGAFLLSETLSEDNPFAGDHLVQFRSMEELLKKSSFYLSHDEEREKIASRGHDEAMMKHTYMHRSMEIADVMTSCIERISPGRTGVSNTTHLPLATEPCRRTVPLGTKPAHTLRIFAAYSQNNWEDHNLLPALQSFGEVVRYDWQPKYDQYDAQWHWGGKQRMNIELLDAVYKAHKEAPIDLFFGYLSGRLVFPSTIRAIGMMDIPTVNICLDDRTKFHGGLEPTGFAGMEDIAGAFSLCWTTEKSAIEKYENVGARALYLPPGANPDVFRPQDLQRDIDVCFVGQRYGKRFEIISDLKRKRIEVQTFGKGWNSGEIDFEEMVNLFSRSRITLGIGLVGDSTDTVCVKGRDFEVPMSGGFYLTQYNPDLQECFEIGTEIACYHSMEDLSEKIRYFLDHPEHAEAIRRAGHRRALRDHTWVQRFEKAFSAMKVIPPNDNLCLPVETKSEPSSVQVNTKDDWTYYLRVGKENSDRKKTHIKDFVLSRKEDIRFLLDVGCNTGEISSQFIPHGIRVLGLDASNRLRHKGGYPFRQCDISSFNEVILNDCTLFLSLYHHLFHTLGITRADQLFYRLLLRTRYLIFDTGSADEKGSDREHWVKSIRTHFASEQALLDHFMIPYQTIGSWKTGGSNRTIVVFENYSFDEKVEVMDEFRRKTGTSAQPEGLASVREGGTGPGSFDKTVFYKLRLGDRMFFAKKHLLREWEDSEIKNIVEVYSRFPREELLNFYGLSKRFGLIYEWVDTLRYMGKVRDEWVHGILLLDADRIEVNGKIKYIDFWSDPSKRPFQKISEESVDKLVKEGESAYAAGETERARELFQKALDKEPNRCDAINNLGVIAFEQDRLDLAESLFLKAHDLFPFHADAIENLARCYEKMRDYREALKWFLKILESGASSVEILNKTGNCLMQLEDLDGARKVYEESLKQDGNQESIRTILNGIEEMRSFQDRVAVSSEGKQ